MGVPLTLRNHHFVHRLKSQHETSALQNGQPWIFGYYHIFGLNYVLELLSKLSFDHLAKRIRFFLVRFYFRQ
jgi:hypothetical protein